MPAARFCGPRMPAVCFSYHSLMHSKYEQLDMLLRQGDCVTQCNSLGNHATGQFTDEVGVCMCTGEGPIKGSTCS